MTISKRIALKSILILLLSIVALTMKGQDTIEIIQGSWTMDFDKSWASVSSENLEGFRNLEPTVQNQIQEPFIDRRLSFAADARFTLSTQNGNSISGTWVIKKNKLILYASGAQMEFRIEECTNQTLVIEPAFTANGSLIVQKWHFTKK